MKVWILLCGCILGGWLSCAGAPAGEPPEKSRRYLLVNLQDWEIQGQIFSDIASLKPKQTNSPVELGAAAIFSYFRYDRQTLTRRLTNFLALAREFELPVVVQIDGEQWWDNRPDLWNWWDSKGSGYNPENRQNVEWTDWGPEHAIRISWRNWGRQLRVKPAPNLMSPKYREACSNEMRYVIPLVLNWWQQLAPEKRHLLVGIKLGWESAVGVNSYYQTNGNQLAERPDSEDPQIPVKPDILPGRGYVPIGYAAVSTLGLARSGELTERQLAEVTKVHLDGLCKVAHNLGVPRDRLFTHCGGWKKGEVLYQSALNNYSCPGWSFYAYAVDPRQDTTAMAALKGSDAPYWAAVEWLGSGSQPQWESAFRRTLSMERCRYLCVYNWSGIQKRPEVRNAITAVLQRAE